MTSHQTTEERKTEKWLASYYHDAGWWSITIDAYDGKDAMARCRKLGMRLDGKLRFTTDKAWKARLYILMQRIREGIKWIFIKQ